MGLTAASVLAVDDNATIRRAISMRLGASGYSVTTAPDGIEALDLIRNKHFDLVLLDLQMPGMCGDEVLRRVRKRFNQAQLPIIMLAASDDKNDINRSLDLGANDYVVKPGDLPILLARIRTQLSLKASLHQLAAVQQQGLQVGASAQVPASPIVAQLDPDAENDDLRFKQVYDNIPISCFTLNSAGQVITANRFATRFFGFSRGEMLHRPVVDFYAEEDRIAASRAIEGVLVVPDRLHRWELRRRKKSGAVIWVRETARAIKNPNGDPFVIVTCEDFDETYRLASRMAHQSSHDELTGLANRKQLEARLSSVIESAQAENTQHSLGFIDLDQFKIINDVCGHAAGDQLIKEVSKLLSEACRRRDLLARIGGDEFAVLLEDTSAELAVSLFGTLREVIEGYRFSWEEKTYRLTASIGIVPIDASCESTTAVMSMADTACYAAKDSGRNRIHVFEHDNTAVSTRRGEMRWATRIQNALQEDRFELTYQTISPLNVDDIGDHFELLVRMRDEFGNLIGPTEFLPAAERYNLAAKLDRWVVSHAMEWFRDNPQRLATTHMCSINLSGQSIGNEGLLQYILDELADSSIPPEKLCFELTETAAISDIVRATRFISSLKERGCLFALDDFGSGFSSFAYLKSLPVDFLKIDGAFVRDINRDSIDLAMVRSINEIGHVMGKKTIAEFVEDEAILNQIRKVGVDYAQGYQIGRPESLNRLLDR
ncbi:MAG: EAL domain-containing protein [Gammaproteobacteria bacterium]|nr:EAL domain-containing protein [Gammaproteobacteria bacterium]